MTNKITPSENALRASILHDGLDSEGPLTLARIRREGLARSLLWHRGGIEEWSIDDWFTAMAGEAGEVCNAFKKLKRTEGSMLQANGPSSIDDAIKSVAQEICDTIFYLDLLAARLDMDLDYVVRDALCFPKSQPFHFFHAQQQVTGDAVLWRNRLHSDTHAGYCRYLMAAVGRVARELDLETDRDQTGFEIGRVFGLLIILAHRLKIDLDQAMRDTFNAVSVRNGFPQRL